MTAAVDSRKGISRIGGMAGNAARRRRMEVIMAEMDDILKNLLSSPEELNKILSLVKGMYGTDQKKTDQNEPSPVSSPVSSESGSASAVPAFSPQPEAPPRNAVPASAQFPDLSVLSKIDPKYVSVAMRVLGEYSADDDKILLLNALKPHLRDERRQRIDRAAQILRITKSIRAALSGLSGGDKLV